MKRSGLGKGVVAQNFVHQERTYRVASRVRICFIGEPLKIRFSFAF
jgi:hypothetical protein